MAFQISPNFTFFCIFTIAFPFLDLINPEWKSYQYVSYSSKGAALETLTCSLDCDCASAVQIKINLQHQRGFSYYIFIKHCEQFLGLLNFFLDKIYLKLAMWENLQYLQVQTEILVGFLFFPSSADPSVWDCNVL